MNKTCTFETCVRPVKGKGLCNAHYQQQWAGKALSDVGEKGTRSKEVNAFEERDGYIVLFLVDKFGNDTGEVLVSKEDFHKVRGTRWCVAGRGYVMSSDSYKVKMHRLIMDPPDGIHIDHINRNKLDNRRENLRVVTLVENNQNVTRKGREGARGVEYNESCKYPWSAQCQRDGVRYKGGRYATKEEAAEAAMELRKKHLPFATD